MSTAAFWARYLWHPLGFAGLEADEFKKRTTAVQLTLFTMLAAIPYSLLYAWLGFPLAPWATFIYLGFSLANLLLLVLTKRYEFFVTAQLVAIILNPIMAHVAIGGFINSSAIILSAILSPLGALMFTDARTARVYFGLFVADVVLAGLWDYRYVSGALLLPKGVLIVSFVSNLVIICLIIYLLIQNVLEKRDEAERELQASLAHLQATQAQMVQREKMAGLGELTAGIAHEIQNPLNFVTNFAEVGTELCQEAQELLAAPALPPPAQAELAEVLRDLAANQAHIVQHGRRAAAIVKAMLEHSRSSAGERAPTDLNALADEYLRLAYHGHRAKNKAFSADLHTDLAPGLPLVTGIEAELGRVLLNLFNNAFYAVHQRHQASEPGYAPAVGVRTWVAGRQVKVCVHDNGTGMPEAVRTKVFQHFFTTKPTGEGTGLGLSLAHEIITQGHGGTLTVESHEGQGTDFIITLPY